MAVRRGNDVFTNPRGTFLLEDGDNLFLLAESYPHGIEDFGSGQTSGAAQE